MSLRASLYSHNPRTALCDKAVRISRNDAPQRVAAPDASSRGCAAVAADRGFRIHRRPRIGAGYTGTRLWVHTKTYASADRSLVARTKGELTGRTCLVVASPVRWLPPCRDWRPSRSCCRRQPLWPVPGKTATEWDGLQEARTTGCSSCALAPGRDWQAAGRPPRSGPRRTGPGPQRARSAAQRAQERHASHHGGLGDRIPQAVSRDTRWGRRPLVEDDESGHRSPLERGLGRADGNRSAFHVAHCSSSARRHGDASFASVCKGRSAEKRAALLPGSMDRPLRQVRLRAALCIVAYGLTHLR